MTRKKRFHWLRRPISGNLPWMLHPARHTSQMFDPIRELYFWIATWEDGHEEIVARGVDKMNVGPSMGAVPGTIWPINVGETAMLDMLRQMDDPPVKVRLASFVDRAQIAD